MIMPGLPTWVHIPKNTQMHMLVNTHAHAKSKEEEKGAIVYFTLQNKKHAILQILYQSRLGYSLSMTYDVDQTEHIKLE